VRERREERTYFALEGRVFVEEVFKGLDLVSYTLYARSSKAIEC
jgi:hypothetical protein